MSVLKQVKAIFLDRDGVLNEAILRNGKPFSPMSVGEVVVPRDVAPSLARLRRSGFRLIMVTNQPNIARGTQTRESVCSINHYLETLLRLDAVETCEHDDADNCDCRKPRPGLILRAAKRDNVALSDSFMIGDRWRDIEAGRRAGCRTILIGEGYGEALRSPPDGSFAALSAATDWILANETTLK